MSSTLYQLQCHWLYPFHLAVESLLLHDMEFFSGALQVCLRPFNFLTLVSVMATFTPKETLGRLVSNHTGDPRRWRVVPRTKGKVDERVQTRL
jgi:hypothetical protein